MKTDKIKIESSTDELKIPYVRLERCSLEEINGYKLKPERNAYYLIESRSEEPNEEESDNNMVSLNFLTLLGDCGRLFRSYVLLERLSPNDIQHLSNKKD
ncbi:uncharacterized protein LOC111031719 [Myzus persicae]|uniref:uncharacterized protein LOC111031719 n=1 Tax=Myzus persicae TaxID=13164 RepID=UPI000B9378E0|nr:uncharacterized protein LOC111031719 [Myzus persicae]XP_022167471.1 uncharacterized protein LOC111031719 [Myzus persicae]